MIHYISQGCYRWSYINVGLHYLAQSLEARTRIHDAICGRLLFVAVEAVEGLRFDL